MYNENFVEDIQTAMEQQIEFAPPPPQDTMTHYGASFLINIPLFRHVGNNKMTDLMTYVDKQGVSRNLSYLPRLVLLPFKNIVADVPSELPATRSASGAYERHAQPFSPVAAESAEGQGAIQKTAKQCAALFVQNYAEFGAAVFHTLTGRTPDEAKKMFLAVLPLNDKQIFPDTSRKVMNETFQAPFLDEILAFLTNHAQDRIANLPAPEEAKEILMALYGEMFTAAQSAANSALYRIEQSEAQISASPQEKKGYDQRDRRFANSPEPLDLLCLAMLNKAPQDERALEQARVLNKEQNNPMEKAAAAMTQAVAAMTAQSAPAITMEQIQAMVADQVAAGVAAALAANQSATAAETVTSAAPATAKKAK